MSIAPPAIVTSAQRQPLLYGLFSVVTPRTGADRWESGVQTEPETCEPVDGLGPLNCDPEATQVGLPKNLDPNLNDTDASVPFTLYGHFACSPLGYTPATAQDLAETHLTTREEAGAEAAFWTGNLGNTPALESTETVTLGGGTAVSAAEGIALLEEHLATEYGSTGIIHSPRGFAVHLVKRSVVERNGGRLQTVLGTPVVAGAGYPGSSPDGVAAPDGQSWVYATPAMFAYRSEVMTSTATPGDLLDRGRNVLYAIAERTYLLGTGPCPIAAVLIDPTL